MAVNPNASADLARMTLIRLADLKLAPTPKNYARVYAELATEAQGDVDSSFPDLLRHELRTLAKQQPAWKPYIQQMTQWLDNEQWEEILKRLFQGWELQDSAEPVWSVLCKNLVREWERRQQGLPYLQKQESLDRVLKAHEQAPALMATELSLLLKKWAALPERTQESLPDDGAEPDTQSPTQEALPASRFSLLKPFNKLFQANDDIASLWRDILRQSLRYGLLPRLSAHPEMEGQLTVLMDTLEQLSDSAALQSWSKQLKALLMDLEKQDQAEAELHQQMLNLLRLFTENMGELLIEDQWLNTQLLELHHMVSGPVDGKVLKNAHKHFKEMIYKQGVLKQSILDARNALKSLVGMVIGGLEQLSAATGDYQHHIREHTSALLASEDINEINQILGEIIEQSKGVETRTRHLLDELNTARQEAEAAEHRIQTLEKELEEVSQLLQVDPLTGALNRRGMEEAFTKEFSRSERLQSPFSIGLIDVDHFKQINDTHGHDLGDEVLKYLVRIFMASLRPTDTLARLGGEEFVVLLPDTDIDKAEMAIARLLKSLAHTPFSSERTQLKITFSAGVTAWDTHESMDDIIDRADKAMYMAKKGGRNRVVRS